MLRVVTNDGRPVTGSEVVTGPIAAVGMLYEGSAANLDLSVEMSAIMAIHLVEGMIRTGIARPESAEAILTGVANGYESLIAGAPDSIRDSASWDDVERRMQTSAEMIRDHVFRLMMGDV